MNPRASLDTPSFVRFRLDSGVLRFGDFTAKSGRQTPYRGLGQPSALAELEARLREYRSRYGGS